MVKHHLKRLTIPKTWAISRKNHKWITKQNPGPHNIEKSMPLNLIIRDVLKYAKITKEVKKILNNKEILIDKTVRKDYRFPVGIFDIIEIPKLKEYYLVIINKKGKLHLKKIDEKDSNIKYLKITGKKALKGNKTQINFYNGNNLLSDKKDYKVNDTLLLDLKNKKILKSIKFQKGSYAYIISGKYSGHSGEIKEIKDNQIEIKSGKDIMKVPKDYIFIIEKDTIKDE